MLGDSKALCNLLLGQHPSSEQQQDFLSFTAANAELARSGALLAEGFNGLITKAAFLVEALAASVAVLSVVINTNHSRSTAAAWTVHLLL